MHTPTDSATHINSQLTDIVGLRASGIFPTGREPSIRTLREWTKLRRIPHHRVGHFVYYDAAELCAPPRPWVRRRKNTGALTDRSGATPPLFACAAAARESAVGTRGTHRCLRTWHGAPRPGPVAFWPVGLARGALRRPSVQRLATRKPMLLFSFVASLSFRFDNRRLFSLLFHEPPRSPRLVLASAPQVNLHPPEDAPPQPPALRMARMGRPAPRALLQLAQLHAPPPHRPHLGAKAPGETPHIRPAQPYTPVGKHHEAAEIHSARRRPAAVFVRMYAQLQPAHERLYLRAPGPHLRPVFTEQDKIIHVAHIARHPQLLLDEAVQWVEVELGEKLARQVADRQPAPPHFHRQQVLARPYLLLGVQRPDARSGPTAGKGKRLKVQRVPRAFLRRIITTPSAIAPIAAPKVLGSGIGARLATRKPMPMTSLVEPEASRSDNRR